VRRAVAELPADRAESLKAAKAVLAIGPDPSLRVEAGRGLARGGDAEGARNVLIAVARDTNAPDVVRGDAYELLIKILTNDVEDWTTAAVVYNEWVTLRPADVRAHKWAPTVRTAAGGSRPLAPRGRGIIVGLGARQLVVTRHGGPRAPARRPSSAQLASSPKPESTVSPLHAHLTGPVNA